MDKPVYLGTAQWGAPYGVTNTDGVPNDAEVTQMLTAPLAGLDTAQSYGLAERRIGHLAPDLPVQTKIDCAGRDQRDLMDGLYASFDRLKRRRVDTLFVHDWAMLTERERATSLEFLHDAKAHDLIGRTGVSIYEASEIRHLPDVDVIQLPASVMDQNTIDSPEVLLASEHGITIQVRSIYLQGVALKLHGMRTCVSYIHHHRLIDEVVVGCATAAQVDEFMAVCAGDLPDHDWTAMACDDWRVTDPRMWP